MGDLTAPYECECVLRQADICPPIIIDSQAGTQNTPKTFFQVLTPGLSYILTVRCSSGSIVRTISRRFYTPAGTADCVPWFINDGISYTGHNGAGEAATVFEWSSSGSPMGFDCTIDDGAPADCKLFNYIMCVVYMCLRFGGHAAYYALVTSILCVGQLGFPLPRNATCTVYNSWTFKCVNLIVYGVSSHTTGDSPLLMNLTATQHIINILPTGCTGDAKSLRRRFEVPGNGQGGDGCILPFSYRFGFWGIETEFSYTSNELIVYSNEQVDSDVFPPVVCP